MRFVATKTTDQLDLQALHRVRERLVSQRTGVINQIRAFMLERGIAVRQGLRFLRTAAMFNKPNSTVATMGIDIGKYSFHVVGLDQRGAIVLRQKWSRGQVEARLANMPPCLIGMEACVGAHHLSRKLQSHGHDARLMPAKYVHCQTFSPPALTCCRHA